MSGVQSANKPLNILERHGFVIYSNNFEQHNNTYDFFNSAKIVDEFLNVVDRKFEVTELVEVQSAFSIVNYESPENEFFEEVIDERSWLTDFIAVIFLMNLLRVVSKRTY